ncbi:hypothetical protein JVU11DRAFT_11477 [Chiua virens]|nr:hypothetical protein JVU11DRAFT_11477 [Chiua virens]
MQTSVYRQIRELMGELVVQCQKKLDSLMEEMADAERDGDEETREELEDEVQTCQGGAARSSEQGIRACE